MKKATATIMVTLFLASILNIALAASVTKFSASSPTEHVMINEFDQNPPGWDYYEGIEWVELFNPEEKDVDISGWKLSTTHEETIPTGRSVGQEEEPFDYTGEWSGSFQTSCHAHALFTPLLHMSMTVPYRTEMTLTLEKGIAPFEWIFSGEANATFTQPTQIIWDSPALLNLKVLDYTVELKQTQIECDFLEGFLNPGEEGDGIIVFYTVFPFPEYSVSVTYEYIVYEFVDHTVTEVIKTVTTSGEFNAYDELGLGSCDFVREGEWKLSLFSLTEKELTGELYRMGGTDLTVLDVKPVQVIWNCNINDDARVDLVHGKTTSVIATIKVDGTLSEDEVIDIQLSFGEFVTGKSLTFQELLSQNNEIIFDIFPEDYFSIPPANYEITIEVDPDDKIDEVDEANNEESVPVTVLDTKPLYIIYFKIDTIDGYGTPTWGEYSSTISNSAVFIGATYPISEDELTIRGKGNVYVGEPEPKSGCWYDVNNLSEWADLVRAHRAVGVVSDNYFSYHGYAATGLMYEDITGAVLVEEGDWTAAAHELGHTYGLCLDIEDYDLNPPLGSRADGMWVSKNHKEIVNGISFMGNQSTMYTFDDVWVADEHYEKLFLNFTDPADTTVLSVRGMLSKDGVMELGNMYILENGIVKPPMPGDYVIQLINSDGRILSETWFDVSFSLHVDPIGIVKTEVGGFAFAIPWEEATKEILIVHENEVLARKLVSANPPIVEVEYPNGGEVLFEGETVKIEWTATDADGYDLTYALLFSRDNGKTWSPITKDISDTGFDWTIPENISSVNCLIKVIASDGVNTSEEISDSIFTVQKLAPEEARPLISVLFLAIVGFLVVVGLLVGVVLLKRSQPATKG